MNKKFYFILILILFLLPFGSISAKGGTINIKGVVSNINGNTLTVETKKDGTYIISVPEEIDMSMVQVGVTVLIKASALKNDIWQAETLKVIGNASDIEEDDEEGDGDTNGHDGGEEEDEGDTGKNKLYGAFCSNKKQGKVHPLAVKIAEQYGVTEEWVMEYFCSGHSMGMIMLALKTANMEGVDMEADTLLLERAGGKPWGQIWQDLKVIGNECNGKSPP